MVSSQGGTLLAEHATGISSDSLIGGQHKTYECARVGVLDRLFCRSRQGGSGTIVEGRTSETNRSGDGNEELVDCWDDDSIFA